MEEALITGIVEEKISGTDCFLVEVKVRPGKILISLDKPAGLTIDDCVEISRYVYHKLENHPILETHELEVSSPGLGQPLKVRKQYEKNIGRRIRVRTLDDREKTGILTEVTPEGFGMEEEVIIKEKGKKKRKEKHPVRLAFTEIKETKIVVGI